MLYPLRVSLFAATAVAACCVAAGAQTVAPPAGPVPRAPDESALRYYASLGQADRVAAETRRLARLFPAWRAPDDLAATKPGRADEGPLWALFSSGKAAELHAAIAAREAVEPNWRPSDDLRDKIRWTELRAAVLGFAAGHDWHGIGGAVKGNGAAWAAKDAEVLWLVGEAYARENDCAEAFVTYRSILATHADPMERVATIERAIATMPMSFVEKLIGMGHAGENGRGEFEGIAIDITRARISAFLHDDPGNPVSPAELDAFKAYVRTVEDANQPALVAWYAFKRDDAREALEWFKLSISHGGDAMVAHGLAHTLRKLGMKREAEEVAYAWRGPLVNNAILFVDVLEEDLTKDTPPFIEPGRIARYAEVTAATASGEGAQALAWYAYNTCQYPLALQWFQRAVAWLPKEATVYGYALTLQRLKRAKDFREIVNRYDGLFPKVVALAFDEGRVRPPPPCEANLSGPSAPPRNEEWRPAAQASPGRTMADTLAPPSRAADRPVSAEANDRYARARVPSPDAGEAPAQALVKRTEFPYAVAPENPLRFSALKTIALENQTRPDRAAKPSALVARRVPGVGAMPYERFGFTLQAGWDGTTEPSSPSAAERRPPQGTPWSFAQSLPDAPRLAEAPTRQPEAPLAQPEGTGGKSLNSGPRS